MQFTVDPPGEIYTYRYESACWQLIIGKPEKDLGDYVLFTKKDGDEVYIHRLSGFKPNNQNEPNPLDQSTIDSLLLDFLIKLYKKDEGLIANG